MLNRSDARKIVPLSFHGLSMLWSPIFGTSEAVVFASLSPFTGLLVSSRLLNLAVLAAFMLVAALLGERLRPLLHRGPFVPLVVAVGSLGMLLGCAAGLGWMPPWVLLCGAIARGFYVGVVTVLWIGLFMHVDDHIVGAAVAGSLVLYATYGIVAVLAAGPFPLISSAMLVAAPALSFLGYRMTEKSGIHSRPVAQEETAAPLATRCMLYGANFMFGLLLGGLLYFFAMGDTLPYILSFLAASAVCLLVFAVFGNRADLRLVYRIFMLCYVAAAVLVSPIASAADTLIPAVASATLAVILLYTIVIFLDTQARFRKPYWRIPGLTQVFASLGMIAAFALSYASPFQLPADGLGLIVLTSACLMFIASIFLSPGNFSSRPWGFSSLIPAESPEMQRMRRCGHLATTHRLTSRELEILQLLASGSSRENIAEVLFISPATAKTHIRNIYAKLSIHSQRELDELLDAS